MPRSFSDWQAEQERESNVISLADASAKVKQRKRFPRPILRDPALWTEEAIDAFIDHLREVCGPHA